MIRILIVDDQNLVQQGIKSLLERDLDFKIVGTVSDGRNAIAQIEETNPDVVLLDIEMPGMNGIMVTKYVSSLSLATKVIILSSHEDKKYVMQALMAGAKGYLLKNSLMTDLKQAILAVNNGYSQIDSRLLAKVFDPRNIKAKKSNSDRKKEVAKQSDSDNKTTHEFVSPSQRKTISTKIEASVNKSQVANSIEKESKPISVATVDIPVTDVERVTSKANQEEQTASFTAIDNFSIEPYRFPLDSKSPKREIKVKQYLANPINRSPIAAYKPQIQRFKTKLIQFLDKLRSPGKQKLPQETVENLGWGVLGLVVVLMVSKII